MPKLTKPADRYSPLYFLASLGAGGLVVTFFMWLYFWVPHPNQPVPLNEDIVAAFATGSMAMRAMIGVAMAGIAALAALNLWLLFWNLGAYRRFKGTRAYQDLLQSNAETQLMAMPLAIAMSINVGFMLGMVFVPGLWGVVEYLFPFALIAFVLTGALALAQLGHFLRRVAGAGGFDWSANGSLAQMLPAFSLAMVGVGLAAPAAMSTVKVTAGIAMILAIFFLMVAIVAGLVKMVLGVHSMLTHGAAPEAAPTIMIVIPILTVLGILMLRVDHGQHVHFERHAAPVDAMIFLTKVLSVQVLFALFGLSVLKAQGYWKRFVFGTETSPGAYALICPGVALSVMTHFWLNVGLVRAGLVMKGSAAYWSISAVAVALQFATIALVLYLNRRHFGRAEAPPVPAE